MSTAAPNASTRALGLFTLALVEPDSGGPQRAAFGCHACLSTIGGDRPGVLLLRPVPGEPATIVGTVHTGQCLRTADPRNELTTVELWRVAAQLAMDNAVG